jgi:hypothetical protein
MALSRSSGRKRDGQPNERQLADLIYHLMEQTEYCLCFLYQHSKRQSDKTDEGDIHAKVKGFTSIFPNSAEAVLNRVTLS